MTRSYTDLARSTVHFLGTKKTLDLRQSYEKWAGNDGCPIPTSMFLLPFVFVDWQVSDSCGTGILLCQGQSGAFWVQWRERSLADERP